MHWKQLAGAVVMLGSFAASAASVDQPVRSQLILDGLSFFAYAGTDKSAFLPSGAAIPIEILRVSDGQWQLTIRAASFTFPPVAFPSGARVEWRLSADAHGSCTLNRDGAACVLDAPLEARPEGGEPMAFPMRFSTQRAQAASDGVVAVRDGAVLDVQSGYLQLVAAGVSPAGAPTAPGKPFVAVLSGRVWPLPAVAAPSP